MERVDETIRRVLHAHVLLRVSGKERGLLEAGAVEAVLFIWSLVARSTFGGVVSRRLCACKSCISFMAIKSETQRQIKNSSKRRWFLSFTFN